MGEKNEEGGLGDYQLNKAKYQRMLLGSYWHQLETNHQLVVSYPLVPNRTFHSLLPPGLIFELLVDYLACNELQNDLSNRERDISDSNKIDRYINNKQIGKVIFNYVKMQLKLLVYNSSQL